MLDNVKVWTNEAGSGPHSPPFQGVNGSTLPGVDRVDVRAPPLSYWSRGWGGEGKGGVGGGSKDAYFNVYIGGSKKKSYFNLHILLHLTAVVHSPALHLLGMHGRLFMHVATDSGILMVYAMHPSWPCPYQPPRLTLVR